jgi:hypothetical protein
MSVEVRFKTRERLGKDEIEYHGKIFDCGRCKETVCCELASSSTSRPCWKCACQRKGGKKCGIATCFKPNECKKRNYNKNPTVWSKEKKEFWSCETAALRLQDTTNYQILNKNDLVLQCTDEGRIRCCRGDTDVSAQMCGNYWGPANQKGGCDELMTAYCSKTENKDSVKCGCINSTIPRPECMDKRCTATAAMKLSNMFDSCDGYFMSCNVYLNLAEGAKENVVTENVISNDCIQTGNDSLSSDQKAERAKVEEALKGKSFLGTSSGKGIVIIAAIVAVLAVGYFVFAAGNTIPRRKRIAQPQIQQ